MRPNINIPWSLHGRVREYAEKKKISVSEAYRIILEKGLSIINER